MTTTLILAQAVLGVIVAIVMIVVALIVGAFLVRTVLILWDMAMGETRRVMRDVRKGRIL